MAHSNSESGDLDEIFGLTQEHLCSLGSEGLLIHRKASDNFVQMQNAAQKEDIDLQIASAFRGFDRQLAIWNSKASGERSCFDDKGNFLDLSSLTDLDAVKAIMRFSALPGASRHHWGTDLDVYDASQISDDYQIQLVASEYSEGGPFHKLNNWLEERSEEFGFSRPYKMDRGGIAPEAWHISYMDQANIYQTQLDVDALYSQLAASDLLLKDSVLHNLQYLFERYIQIP